MSKATNTFLHTICALLSLAIFQVVGKVQGQGVAITSQPSSSKSSPEPDARKSSASNASQREEVEIEIIERIRADGSKVFTTNYHTNVWRLATDASPSLSLTDNYFHINSGVILLNPYTLEQSGSVTELKDGDAQAQFYIEFAANYTWSWNLQRRWDWHTARATANTDCWWKHLGQGDSPLDANYTGEWSLFGIPDFHGRVSYLSLDDEEVSAAAIVGSGEFGMETTIGFPFRQSLDLYDNTARPQNAKELYDNTVSAHWFGAVFSWSGVTDSSSFDIHSRYFAGLGYRAAFKAPWESTATVERRELALNFQIGAAWLDAIEFKNDSTTEIVTGRNGRPKYNSNTSLGVEAEIYVPINRSLNAVIGARLYPLAGEDTANSWNSYLGLTVPLSKLSTLLQ